MKKLQEAYDFLQLFYDFVMTSDSTIFDGREIIDTASLI